MNEENVISNVIKPVITKGQTYKQRH